MVLDHQLHSLPAQNTNPIKLSAIEHHLLKTEVVARGRYQSTGAHKVDVGFFYKAAFRCGRINQFDVPVFVRSVLRCESIEFAGREVKVGIVHVQGFKDVLLEEFIQC